MKISVVVPCYNVANVLERCVESVMRQSFKEWELLLIDDGSVDDTSTLCEAFACKSEKITYIRKNNGGVSSARNLGIEQSSGEYITFIDADDYVDASYLDELLRGCMSDITISGFTISDGRIVKPEQQHWLNKELSEGVKSIVEDDYLLYSPWGKLFKRSIILKAGLRFDRNLRLGEDTLFCYDYLMCCDSICVLPYSSYHYIGEWGGGDKYKLSYEEALYLDTAEVNAIRGLNNRFGCNIDIRYRGFHVRLIKNLYAELNDRKVWEVYCKTHGSLNVESFYHDEKLSILFWSIVDLESLYRNKRYKEAIMMMRQLNRFFTLPFSILKTYSPKMKFLLWNIRHGYYVVNHIFLVILFGI